MRLRFPKLIYIEAAVLGMVMAVGYAQMAWSGVKAIMPVANATEPPSCTSLSVHDGDTMRCDGERIRLANIDAPELSGSSRCSAKSRQRLAGSNNPPWCDHALGARSRDALRSFVAGGRVAIRRQGVDRYGRTLATVSVGGRDAGAYLIGQGLARAWR